MTSSLFCFSCWTPSRRDRFNFAAVRIRLGLPAMLSLINSDLQFRAVSTEIMMGLNRFRPQCVSWWCSSTVWPLCTTQSSLGGLLPLVFNPAQTHAYDDDDADGNNDNNNNNKFIMMIISIIRCSQITRLLKPFLFSRRLGHVTLFRPCSLTDLSF